MIVINLTPHAITVRKDDYSWTFEPSGIVARCETQRVYETDGVWVTYPDDPMTDEILPVCRVVYGNVTGLPAPAKDTVYIVSSIVAQAVPDREDVLVPDNTFRDAEGRISDATGLLALGKGVIELTKSTDQIGRNERIIIDLQRERIVVGDLHVFNQVSVLCSTCGTVHTFKEMFEDVGQHDSALCQAIINYHCEVIHGVRRELSRVYQDGIRELDCTTQAYQEAQYKVPGHG